MEKQNYIGRKVKGFSFDNGVNKVAFADEMINYIGKIGVITSYNEDNLSFRVQFDDDYWFYPASLIDQYLIPEEQDYTELRDQFAMQALNALIQKFVWKNQEDIKTITDTAYIFADSMLKSRKEVIGE